MDIEQLYRDFNVDYVTEGHKHARQGWVNTVCPFCTGNPGYHLGYDIQGDKYVCWRCGGHSVPVTISAVLNIQIHEAYTLLRQYGALKAPARHKMKHKIRKKSFKFPSNITDIQENHKKYLINRKFDPDFLIQEFGILGTGVHSKLDNLDYKHRIIIPYVWQGNVVSFDSRDITKKAKNKYLACPLERELIEHKKILYGRPDKWTDVGIIVEGSTDVWRMGVESCATSGIKYTPAQLRLISKTFKRAAILYDPDPQAIIQANKLVADLKFRGVKAFRVDLKCDPGDLSQSEAEYIKKDLLKVFY